jgi:class 3 adenylate cyclase
MVEMLTAGRQAIETYDWDRALEAFVAADREDGLGPDDLILLADAQWWLGSLEDAERSLERAYSGFLDQGLKTDAALVSALLAYMAFRRLAISVGSGWVSRTEHLVESEPESSANAWLALHRLNQAMMSENDMEGAVRLADEAFEVATRTNTPEVRSLALSLKGMAKVMMGEWREGMSLIDEAVVMAISEQKDLRATSDVYCITIAACSELADYRRATEWTDRAEKWMEERGVGGYPGVCQVHRAELKLLHGDWPDALEEAERACRELERFSLFLEVGFARYEIGEVKRRMGDLAGAEEAFSGAYEYGHPAQPGLSLLMLDRGQVDDAARSIAAALEQASGPGARPGSVSLMRGSLLPAQVEISLAADDTETAVSAVEELEEVARVFESPAWHARAMTCRGAVELHRGNLDDAIDGLGRAWRLWQDLGLPYENARSRELLARARLAKGDTMSAGLELKAARAIFSRLGAKRDLKRLDEVAAEAGITTGPDRTRETKTFMFTDIVASTDLIALVGDEAWENLREWHDRSLRDCFRRHRGEEVNHMGDGFFVAFDDPREALDCAVEIQRRLGEHRREHGFAPWVRIGLHTAEATRQGDDYSGGAVHVAARIGDLGEREEIVVSAPTLGAIGEVSLPVSEPRTVTLKGVSGPIEVHTVDWR